DRQAVPSFRRSGAAAGNALTRRATAPFSTVRSGFPGLRPRAPDDDGAVNAQALLDSWRIAPVVLAPVLNDLDLAVARERTLQVGEEIALIACNEDDPFGAL